jgi:outer membrane protein TolC
MKKFLIFAALFFLKSASAQMMTPEVFIQQVRQYHPIAKQAAIQVAKAQADLLSARGGFDPAITLDARRKTFDGKNYYYYTNHELKLPTRIGGLDLLLKDY